jgi:hypothetical protein
MRDVEFFGPQGHVAPGALWEGQQSALESLVLGTPA